MPLSHTLVEDLSLRGTPSSAKKMHMKESVDSSNFQDGTVVAFAEGVQHNYTEARNMLMTLQSDQKVTEAAVGTTPGGFATVWFTLGGVCDMVNQHETTLRGLPDHGTCMREVNLLLEQVQTSVAEAVWDASLASGMATLAILTLTTFLIPNAGGP